MRDLDLDMSGKQVALAQTVGMRDYITYPLGKQLLAKLTHIEMQLVVI